MIAVVNAKSPSVALNAIAQITRNLNAEPLAGVTDIVPAYVTVTVHFDPAKVVCDASGEETPLARVGAWIKAAATRAGRSAAPAREVVVPVCYGGERGPDLADVAAHAKLSEAAVIRAHCKPVYRVAAVGFSPGFPYLLGLPSALAAPRRETPRLKVPAGSVAIGGVQTGIYPLASPGGWNVIGKTPLRLFRPEDETRPTLLEPGDRVRFVGVSETEAANHNDAEPSKIEQKVSRQAAVLEVLKPGALTTVQDLGRSGRQHQGISVGGAMDRQAARVANVLLGNDENAPLLEAVLTGPEVKFLRDTWVAVTGARVREVPGWRPLRVRAGQVLSLLELTRGGCVYLAVAGGLDIAPVLGGAGTSLRAGLGGWNGRALKAGDRLASCSRTIEAANGWWAATDFDATEIGEVTVRCLPGPQWGWFSETTRRMFFTESFTITPKSDRMGLRLDGPVLKTDEQRDLVSEGVGFGTVQVPPDGKPIVLMADRQTIGGYPKIGHVIAADLSKLAQTRPGGRVRFKETTLGEARALYFKQEQSLAWLKAGVRAKVGDARP